MQIDMHYSGTFAMAHAAGLQAGHATIIATSSQLIDDNNLTQLHTLASGEAVMGVATAHHPLNAGERIKGLREDDSRLVWVPFHFLPGNLGNTFEERVVAVQDSEVAQTMMRYYGSSETIEAHRGHCLQLIGIASHVYADTFSHYGFSGISSNLNDVKPDTIGIHPDHAPNIREYLLRKADEFKERFTARMAEAVDLGHGSVATFPDRPYLRWWYLDHAGRRVDRNNPGTFLQGCRKLHECFCRFRDLFYRDGRPAARSFEDIRPHVERILALEAPAAERQDAWARALASGLLGPAVQIPPYSDTEWMDALKGSNQLSYDPATGYVRSEGYNFLAAADYHRNYVLKRLLPAAGLFVA